MTPLLPHKGHSALKCRQFQITRRETKPNEYQRNGEHGGNGGGGRHGGGGGNGRGGESGGVGGNRGGGGSKTRSGGGGKQKKSKKDSDCYFCLEPHNASECPNRSASATAPATPNSQYGGCLGSVRTNIGAGLLVATNARPALAARGAPREWHEDEYWVADSGATEYMTQDSFHPQD